EPGGGVMAARLCSIEGCNRPHRTRGWCDAHYTRWRKHGDPLAGGPIRTSRPETCSIEGCNRPHEARGWCKTHYTRWRRHGDPTRRPGSPTCSIEGCNRPHKGRGWCETHYTRWRRHGDPLAGAQIEAKG